MIEKLPTFHYLVVTTLLLLGGLMFVTNVKAARGQFDEWLGSIHSYTEHGKSDYYKFIDGNVTCYTVVADAYAGQSVGISCLKDVRNETN